ncbi:hypothetical protein EI94DRAFT_1636053, partial [Lactarius quietus]
NRYKQLLRASCQWRDRLESGLGHQSTSDATLDGAMVIFCPACPQPGINLPKDWKMQYTLEQLIQTFIMDGNFSAEHMHHRSGEKEVSLSPGMAFMANLESYRAHLHIHILPFRQINMDYSICKALSYNMEDIPVVLVMYDIMCQYSVHFRKRVENSPELTLPSSLELQTGIGLFHIHGHQDSCLPCFSPSYIPGAKQVNVLDAHINHSNWKKLVQIGVHHSFHTFIESDS